jgi:hypothetical protein
MAARLAQGRRRDAERIARRALASARATLGPRHPDSRSLGATLDEIVAMTPVRRAT